MKNIKMKNLLKENMRRFGTKNISSINENEYSHLQFAKKKTYDNVWNDISSAASELADALETPKMEDQMILAMKMKTNMLLNMNQNKTI